MLVMSVFDALDSFLRISLDLTLIESNDEETRMHLFKVSSANRSKREKNA